MGDVKKEAYEQAVEVIKKLKTSHGFFAAYPGYNAIWARDSMIISLGASLLGNKYKNTFKQSLMTLADYQSKNGQIPNAVDKYSLRKGHVDYASIDSSNWFIIGEYIYKKRYNDSSLLKKHKKQIDKAINWLSCQDYGEKGMLAQQPTTDWQDAFPHRYGHTINTQALYHKVLTLTKNKKSAKKLRKTANKDQDKKLWDENFYLPWRWKNHNKYQEKGEWFDSLGNLLAIIFELADKNKANKILDYIEKKKINKPYPMKAIYPPIERGSKDWHDYFADSDAGKPYHYSNAGVWTFIGGFYVLALIKMKRFKDAEEELENIAKANMKDPYFSEWLHGKTGKTMGKGNQGWNAGMYILAYESVKRKKVLI